MEKSKEIEAIKKSALQNFNTYMGEDCVEESIHGIQHWEEVAKNGKVLSMQEEVDELVVELFAYIHDCRRKDDGIDANHGLRSAEFVIELHSEGYLDFLSISQLSNLEYACANHNLADVSLNPTIGACYDADRLELFRVGIIPDPELMNTEIGKFMAEKIQKTISLV